VYGGRNIYQYLYDNSLVGAVDPPELWSVPEETNPDKSARYRVRERTFNSGRLKRAIYTNFGGEETSQS
jgi:hypothetical protein